MERDARGLFPWTRAAREGEASRRETLMAAAREIPGAYVPSLYEVSYEGDGRVAAVTPVADGVPERVLPAYVGSLEEAYFPTSFPVPHTKTTHDRIAIEVMRGCTQGCRFPRSPGCVIMILGRSVRPVIILVSTISLPIV